METQRKVRLQAYLDPSLVDRIRTQARDQHRPESWEVERLLTLGLQVSQGMGERLGA
jgi:hypothetical protein